LAILCDRIEGDPTVEDYVVHPELKNNATTYIRNWSTTDIERVISLDVEINSSFTLSQNSGTTPFFTTLSQQTWCPMEPTRARLRYLDASATIPLSIPIFITVGPISSSVTPGQLSFGHQAGTSAV
jgi:hypothetical protein